jgi:hypothetical protein
MFQRDLLNAYLSGFRRESVAGLHPGRKCERLSLPGMRTVRRSAVHHRYTVVLNIKGETQNYSTKTVIFRDFFMIERGRILDPGLIPDSWLEVDTVQ